MKREADYKRILPDVIRERFSWTYTLEILRLADHGFIEDERTARNLLMTGFLSCRRVDLSETAGVHCVFDAVILTPAGKDWVFRIREEQRFDQDFSGPYLGDPLDIIPDEPASIFREDMLLSSDSKHLRQLHKRSARTWTRKLPNEMRKALKAGDRIFGLEIM